MNENRPGSRRKKWREMGYYAVLFLCVAAVGVSGYVFVTAAIRQGQRQELSAPVQATLPPEQPAKPAVSPEELPPKEETAPAPDPKAESVAPLQGEILQNFSVTALSYNTTTRDWRLHSAVDIAAQPGQEVCACMAGTVKAVFEDDYLGGTVVLTHEGGYETRYSSLSKVPAVAEGDKLAAGDVLGTVEDTAVCEAAAPVHLHFQVLQHGTPVDPTEFLG